MPFAPRIPRVIPGQPIPTRSLTRLAASAARTARTWAAGGLASWFGPGGPTWRSPARRPIFVRLSGSTSPYSGVEVIDTAGGGWATVTGGLTFSASLHEDNTRGGLAGKVVAVEQAGPGWWRFCWRATGVAAPPGHTCIQVDTVAGRTTFTPITLTNSPLTMDWYFYGPRSTGTSIVYGPVSTVFHYGLPAAPYGFSTGIFRLPDDTYYSQVSDGPYTYGQCPYSQFTFNCGGGGWFLTIADFYCCPDVQLDGGLCGRDFTERGGATLHFSGGAFPIPQYTDRSRLAHLIAYGVITQ